MPGINCHSLLGLGGIMPLYTSKGSDCSFHVPVINSERGDQLFFFPVFNRLDFILVLEQELGLLSLILFMGGSFQACCP